MSSEDSCRLSRTALGCVMASELEVPAAECGDVRWLAIHRRGVEGTHERPSVTRADRRTIEPVHPMHRGPDRRQRPLPPRAVRDRQMGNLARRIVARQNAIARCVPVLGPRGIRVRPGRRRIRRPSDRVHRQRLELEAVSFRTGAAPGNVKGNGGAAAERRDREAAVVELLLREGRRRSTLVRAERKRDARHRVAHDLELATPGRDHAVAGRRPEQIADPARLPRSQVHDAAPRRAPSAPAACADVEVILI
jgi:hypothetical protein